MSFSGSSLLVGEVLGGNLGVNDLALLWAPQIYAVLLLRDGREAVVEAVHRMHRLLALRGAVTHSSVAHFPLEADPATEFAAFLDGANLPGVVEVAAPTGATAMNKLERLIQQIAVGSISVLITGETGVGKEVLAEQIHQKSPRSAHPFVRLNCAALSETLLESELFGHEKGAFTGALQAKPGLLETAQGGTVFLDEVGEMSPSTQAKLLRVLEQREVLRVGATRMRPIDVRFVAATNRALSDEIARGRFRQDLYFRLNGATLRIPPLRERSNEILPLAERFIGQFAELTRPATVPLLQTAAAAALQNYRWPGNIRELRNVIERAVLICEGGMITLGDLALDWLDIHPDPLEVPVCTSTAANAERSSSTRLRDSVDALELQRIVEALAQAGGNQTHAAKFLGISRNTLRTRLDRFELPRPRKRRS